jgi:hypothetical protein
VLYRLADRQALWSSGTDGRSVTRAVMQDDGNFVVYGPNAAQWETQTAGSSGKFLVLQDDGNLVIYPAGPAVWQSQTNQ